MGEKRLEIRRWIARSSSLIASPSRQLWPLGAKAERRRQRRPCRCSHSSSSPPPSSLVRFSSCVRLVCSLFHHTISWRSFSIAKHTDTHIQISTRTCGFFLCAILWRERKSHCNSAQNSPLAVTSCVSMFCLCVSICNTFWRPNYNNNNNTITLYNSTTSNISTFFYTPTNREIVYIDRRDREKEVQRRRQQQQKPHNNPNNIEIHHNYHYHHQ